MNTRFAAIAGTLLVGLSLFVTSIISNNLNNTLTSSSEAQVAPTGVPACTDDNNVLKRYIRSAIGNDTMNDCGQGRFYYCEPLRRYSRQLLCSDGRPMPRDSECKCMSVDEMVVKYREFCCTGATATATPPTGTLTSTVAPGETTSTPVQAQATPTPLCLQENTLCGASVRCCNGLQCDSSNPRKCVPRPTDFLIAVPISGMVRIQVTPYPTINYAPGCFTNCDAGCANGTSCKDLDTGAACDPNNPFAKCKCVRQTDGCRGIVDPNERMKCYCIDKTFCENNLRKSGCTSGSCPMYYSCKRNPNYPCVLPHPTPGNGNVDCNDPEIYCKHYPQFCGCVDSQYCPQFPRLTSSELTTVLRRENPSLLDFLTKSSNELLRNIIGL